VKDKGENFFREYRVKRQKRGHPLQPGRRGGEARTPGPPSETRGHPRVVLLKGCENGKVISKKEGRMKIGGPQSQT